MYWRESTKSKIFCSYNQLVYTANQKNPYKFESKKSNVYFSLLKCIYDELGRSDNTFILIANALLQACDYIFAVGENGVGESFGHEEIAAEYTS